MNRKAALLLAAIVVVIVAASGFAWLRPSLAMARAGDRIKDDAERAAARVSPQWRKDTDAVLADAALWATLMPKRERDAATYLAPLVPLRDDAGAVAAAAGAAHALPELPSAVVDALSRADFAWHADQVPLDGVDTSWMRPLPGFTHWDLEAAPERKAEPDTPTLMAARPEILPLVRWAELRLVEGIARGQEQAASDEVRALARLLWSTDQLLAGVVAAKLLDDDAEAREVGRGLGVVYTTADIASAKKLEKVLLSDSLLYAVYTPTSLAAYEQSDVVLCGAIGDGVAGFLLGGGLFSRHAERRASIGAALEKSPCALTRVRRQWKDGTGAALPAAGDLREVVVHRFLEGALVAATAMRPQGYFADALATE